MPDEVIQYGIEVRADTSGPAAEAAAFDKVTAATTKLTDETERYQQALEKLANRDALAQQTGRAGDKDMEARAAARKIELAERQALIQETDKEISSSTGITDKTREYINTIGAATDGVKKNDGAHKALHNAMHLITQQAPILGLAFRAAMSPVTAVIMAAIYAFGRLKEDINQLNASLSTASLDGYTKKVEALKASIEAAKAEFAAFQREMARAATKKDTASEGSERYLNEMKANAAAREDLAEAQKKNELDKTKEIKDPEARAAAEANIEKRYGEAKRKRTDENSIRERAELHRRIALEEHDQREAAVKLVEARKKQDALGTEEGVNSEIETSKGRVAAIDKEIAEKKARHDELAGMSWLTRSTPQEHEMDYLAEQIKQAEATKAQQQALLRKQESARPDKINQIRAAGEGVTELEGVERGAADRANALRREMPSRDRVAGIESGARAGVAIAPEANRQIGEAEGIAARVMGGQKTNTSEQDILRSVATLVSGQNQSLQNAARMLDNAAKHPEVQSQMMQRLVSVMEKMGSGLERYERRIQALEARLQASNGTGAR